MNKQQFIEELRKSICGLPKGEVEERIAFYDEMIEDRIEDGLSEEEAVGSIGCVHDIARQIIADTPLAKIVKHNIKPKKRSPMSTALIIIGAPLWVPLLLAAFAVIIALYAVLWALVISLWACDLSLLACSLGGFAAGGLNIYDGNLPAGVLLMAGGLICGGLSIFLFFGCRWATTGTAKLAKKMAYAIKKCFIKKEDAG